MTADVEIDAVARSIRAKVDAGDEYIILTSGAARALVEQRLCAPTPRAGVSEATFLGGVELQVNRMIALLPSWGTLESEQVGKRILADLASRRQAIVGGGS